MFQVIPTWVVTFKPCKEIPEVALRVSQDDLEPVMRSLRMSQIDAMHFEREGPPPQIPEPPARTIALQDFDKPARSSS